MKPSRNSRTPEKYGTIFTFVFYSSNKQRLVGNNPTCRDWLLVRIWYWIWSRVRNWVDHRKWQLGWWRRNFTAVQFAYQLNRLYVGVLSTVWRGERFRFDDYRVMIVSNRSSHLRPPFFLSKYGDCPWCPWFLDLVSSGCRRFSKREEELTPIWN